MNPERAEDRLTLLGDFGASCRVRPLAGGPEYALPGLFNRPEQQPSEIDFEGAPTQVASSDPWLLVPAEHARKLHQGDLIVVPTEDAGEELYRVHTVEPHEDDGAFRHVDLIAGSA